MIETPYLLPIYPHIPFHELANYSSLMLQWNLESLYHQSNMFSKESSIELNSAEKECHAQ
jgi:hypothetical protein